MSKQDFMTRQLVAERGHFLELNVDIPSIESTEVGVHRIFSTRTGWPRPRGPLSAAVISALQREPGSLGSTPPIGYVDPLSDDDFGLALYLCYEVHYRGSRVDEWEWDPDLIRFRGDLEQTFALRLREEIGHALPRFPFETPTALDELIRGSAGPSLSSYLSDSGTRQELQEFCIHRSAYQLKEADPHTFCIPRLTGVAKAAMVEIQYDEYGSGDAANMHSALFADTMAALDLDSTYGAYVDVIPGVTLSTVNLVSMFGLHYRWRGASVGHLAVFEMTSVEPMRRYSKALARFGIGPEGRRFYDVHVKADAEHAVIARDRMVAGLVASEPELGPDVLFGAAAVLLLEQRFVDYLLDAWSEGRSSLLKHELGQW